MINVGKDAYVNLKADEWKNISISINASKMSSKDLYLASFGLTQSILWDVFRLGAKEEATDVYAVAKHFNVEIFEKKMTVENNVFQYGMPGYLDCFDYKPKEYEWTIYVNEGMGDLTKRYIIAHELAHFFLVEKNTLIEPKNCCNPLMPKTTEEQLCDIIASFLLMPIDIVLGVMKNFINKCEEKNRVPVDMYEWLKYLGAVMGVSDYHTILCFQNVRYLGGAIFEEKDTPNYMISAGGFNWSPIFNKISKEYVELFR